MKITKTKLKQIIKEEVEAVEEEMLNEEAGSVLSQELAQGIHKLQTAKKYIEIGAYKFDSNGQQAVELLLEIMPTLFKISRLSKSWYDQGLKRNKGWGEWDGRNMTQARKISQRLSEGEEE